jgi:hypothetical protein
MTDDDRKFIERALEALTALEAGRSRDFDVLRFEMARLAGQEAELVKRGLESLRHDLLDFLKREIERIEATLKGSAL